MNILVDTDILIEITRARNTILLDAWAALVKLPDPVLYTPVTASEIWAGARPSEFRSTTLLLQSLHCIEISCAIGEMAGHFLRTYAKSHRLQISDALIAASAIHSGAHLWTRNRKHYPMPELLFY